MPCTCFFHIPVCDDIEDHHRRMKEDFVDEPVRANVWDAPEPKDVEPIQYTSLNNILNFTDFDPEFYMSCEMTVLQPQLEALGYRVEFWSDEPHNYLAHATARVCKCVDRIGGIRWFVYG